MLIQEAQFKPETYFYVLWGSIFSNILPKLEIPSHRWKLTFLNNNLNNNKATSIYTSWAILEKNQTRKNKKMKKLRGDFKKVCPQPSCLFFSGIGHFSGHILS